MDAIRQAGRGSICTWEEEGAGPPPGATAYTVKKGDTLSKLADQLRQQGLPGTRQEVLGQLMKLNPRVKDADVIRTGETLYLPAVTGVKAKAPDPYGSNRVEAYTGLPPPKPTPPTLPPGAVQTEPTMLAGMLALVGIPRAVKAEAPRFLRENGVPFPASADGTPLYKQGDKEDGGDWWELKLGTGPGAKTLKQAGCAMTSMAMALSKLTGKTITPKVLDGFLDAHKGYSGNNILWSVAAKIADPPLEAEKQRKFDLRAINASLDAGRPVVVAVDYKGDSAIDHWVCLTRRDAKDDHLYYANDPTTGKEVLFRRQADGTLKQEPVRGERIAGYHASSTFITLKPASRG